MTVRRALLLLPATILALLVALPAFAQDAGFTDTLGTRHEDAVFQLAERNIVNGCREDLFCARDQLTRGQGAAIVARALGLPTDVVEGTPRFADIATSTHRGAIEAVAAAGLTNGCTEEDFCPNGVMTREQLASMLVRAFEVPDAPPGVTYFSDARGVHEPAVNALAELGVAHGCTLTEFCATRSLERAHAATFLARTLGLVERVPLASFEERLAEHEAEREAAAAAAKAKAEAAAASAPANKAVDVALAQVGKPYRYGASGPGAFDCSGLTSFAWKAAGVTIPRSSGAQYAGTTRISRSELKPGDLVFYHSPISHVAMYIGDGKVVEAANSRYDVRIRNDGLTRSGLVGFGRPKY